MVRREEGTKIKGEVTVVNKMLCYALGHTTPILKKLVHFVKHLQEFLGGFLESDSRRNVRHFNTHGTTKIKGAPIDGPPIIIG